MLQCIREWRKWIRPFVLTFYFVVMLIALPLIIIEFQTNGIKITVQAWFIGGLFVLMTLPISFWGILQHLVHYTQPHLQKFIIRILWMVPIYSVNAWFALRFKNAAIYLDTARECYEAYVIYNFMSFLMSFLRTELVDVCGWYEGQPEVKHFFPFCCIPKWRMGEQMLNRCKHGVLQYVVIRPLTTLLAFICEMTGHYHEGDFNFVSAWSYLAIINNISQAWAMYSLVLFYRVTKRELAPIRPVSKFLIVKAVIFFSFWQQVIIAILVKVGWIKSLSIYTVQDISTGLQDFCICIEMFFAAVAHYYCFSHKQYIDDAAEHADCCSSFMSMWDVSDVRDDVFQHVRHVGATVKQTVARPLRPFTRTSSERTPLLGPGSAQPVSMDRARAVDPVERPPSPAVILQINNSEATECSLLPDLVTASSASASNLPEQITDESTVDSSQKNAESNKAICDTADSTTDARDVQV